MGSAVSAKDEPKKLASARIASDFSPDVGQKFLDAINSFRDGIRHIDQRWKDGLALNHADLIEKYFSRGLSLVAYFHSIVADTAKIQASSGLKHERSTPNQCLAIVIDNAEISDCLECVQDDEQTMLVTTVQSMEGPQKATRGLVRPYLIDDEFANAGNGELYGSIPTFLFDSARNRFSLGAKGRYKFLPLLPHRKRESVILPAGQFVDDIVESAAKIVNRIPNRKQQLGWKRLSGEDVHGMASLGVFLHRDLVEIRLEKSFPEGLELVDVFCGPYVL